LIGLVLVVGAFLALVGISLTSGIAYYVTPTELAAAPPSGNVRLYGIVEPGSVRWEATSSTLSFRITDGATTVAVTSRSLPTGLFRDGIGVVLAGRVTAPGTFGADEVLVKHSEVYEPLKPGETPPPGLLETIREEAP
jgi:cytochrome c-type biogenesis protein CcmE